jgi:hypothetical protein
MQNKNITFFISKIANRNRKIFRLSLDAMITAVMSSLEEYVRISQYNPSFELKKSEHF